MMNVWVAAVCISLPVPERDIVPPPVSRTSAVTNVDKKKAGLVA
jgi:hypothetical protein